MLVEILKDLQDGARELLRALPGCDGEEPLRRIAQMQEQLDGLTAAAVGRARHRRVTWGKISSILQISEDTSRRRFTDRYILRRVARFTRSAGMPDSVVGLYSAQPPIGPEGSPPAPVTAESSRSPAAGTDEPSEPAQGAEPSGAAYNRLAPILSMLIRTSQLSIKEVSEKIGCSASYLSRLLSGERVPTWDLTRKFARVCGADPDVLRSVWESQKLSQRSRDATVVDFDGNPMPATERLRTAVQTLHLKAGRPAPHDIAVASRWTLGIHAVASVLEGESLPDGEVLGHFVRLLGGKSRYFEDLLLNAQRELESRSTPHSPLSHASEPTSQGDTEGETAPPTGDGLDEVLKKFSTVFAEQDPVEDGRARILQKMAQKGSAGGHSTLLERLERARPRGAEGLRTLQRLRPGPV
ncbi:helix-turn-helix domain-containing protein [Streptomyces gardneri]|uniref:helix-turn-helix domain-containing protein n=1 Tax=Streptomyces gardneri TaxID=66892 RepID=UPI0037D3FBA4